MSTMDGYPLAKQGKAGIALSLSAMSSFIGSLIAIIGIVLFAPLLAKWAIVFGPAEYFVLMVFALTCLSGLVGDQPIKTAVAALIGLLFATVGVDAVTGVYRFTFDSVNLSDGVQFTTIVIGFFSISEILIMLEKTAIGQKALGQGKRSLFNLKEFLFTLKTTIRSSLLGFIVGIYRAQAQQLPVQCLIPANENLREKMENLVTAIYVVLQHLKQPIMLRHVVHLFQC